ncbi:winged helix-turn-helix domain-containing protein, partial [Rhodopseudomonas sp. B29]|uniref:winged helix-turn-helix domain-containing tetratricopeptide repeat protein n=1 Tax=Rhodopseudomonas sp. B29 TaxID=95607 RepID=UPI0003B5CAFF
MLYHFNNFVLDSGKRELRCGEQIVATEPQVFDLLELLIASRDRIVSRDDMLAKVWNGRIVSEATLSSRISAARAAIGDNGDEQKLIRTIARRGFRFVGEVREQAEAAPEPIAETLPRFEGPSIAVLPFANMSGDAEQDYFADGIVEDIITALSRCSGLVVIARNSSFAYRGRAVDVRTVGRELGVGYVLEGSVRRGGEQLRITGQLVDAESGAHLWADRFDGELGDVFTLQDRITECVVAAIEPTLHLAEARRLHVSAPAQLDSYDMLLRASSLRNQFTPESLIEALRCLDDALALNPDYPSALAASAYCQALRHFQGWITPAGDHSAQAVARAWRAAELAPSDPQVLWMAAFAIWNMADDPEPARELFARSLSINPNSATALALSGWIETMRGDQQVGRVLIDRALRINPRDPQGWFAFGALAICEIADRRFKEAVTWAERALAQNRRFTVALRVLIVALIQIGEPTRAREAAQRLIQLEPDFTVSGFMG